MARIKTAYNLDFSGFKLDQEPEALANAAKYDQQLINVASYALVNPATNEPPVDWAAWLKESIADATKAINPDTRVGLYIAGALLFHRPWEPCYIWTRDDPVRDSIHDPTTGAAIVSSSGASVPPADGTFYRNYTHYGDAGVRSRHIAYYRAWLAENNLDSVFFDTWNPLAYAYWINGTSISASFISYPGGVREGPLHTTSYWCDVIGTWTRELRDALAEDGHKVWANGLSPAQGVDPVSDAFLGTFNENTLDYASGVIFELAFEMYGNAAKFSEHMGGLVLALTKPGDIFFFPQPWLLNMFYPDGSPDYSGSTVGYTYGPDLERFYLATFLIFTDPERCYFGYHDGNAAYQGFIGPPPYHAYVWWSEDLERDYGDPTGRHQHGGPTGLWWREYTLGYAVVNPTDEPLPFLPVGTYRLWDPEGPRIDVSSGAPYQVPAYTGVYLFHDREAA